MLRVERVDDQIKRLPKPAARPVTTLVAGSDDCVIICAGFEDRALEMLNRMIKSGSKGFRLVVVCYLPFQQENQVENIAAVCRQADVSLIKVTYDRQNPVGAGEILIEQLAKIQGRLFIDISAMSRLLILQLIVAYKNTIGNLKNLSILYSEALQYPPCEEDVSKALKHQSGDPLYRTLFISSGVFELAVVPELSSLALPGQPMMLVAFPSFNVDQLGAVLGELQPYNTLLIHGVPPRKENTWRTDAIRMLNHTEKLPQREDANASTLDYRDALSILLRCYSEHGEMERLVISATGSKMQTVAVGIFRAFMSDVQIVYPTSFLYPKPHEYTIGVQEAYQLDLDLFDLEAGTATMQGDTSCKVIAGGNGE